MGQDMLVDVGLTWRISPWLGKTRTNRIKLRARLSTPLYEDIVGMLLGEYKKISDQLSPTSIVGFKQLSCSINIVGKLLRGNK